LIPHLLEEAFAELESFAREPRVLIAFDYDGTLSPIAPTPEEALIDPAVAAALTALMTLSSRDTAVAVVSGRPVKSLQRLIPRVSFLVGLHGLEIQAGNDPPRMRADTAASDGALERLRSAIAPLLARGARLEDKRHTIALHVRGLPEADAREAIRGFIDAVEAERAAGAPLEWVHGKAVVEARPPAARKSLGIAEILRSLASPALLFAGDDTTDEEVFAAFPRALTVAVMEAPRDTAARTYLRSPSEVAEMVRRITELRA
jgi:trehalose 6-phosphate phosphatase